MLRLGGRFGRFGDLRLWFGWSVDGVRDQLMESSYKNLPKK